MDRKITSRSDPWKSAESPQRSSRACHSSGGIRSINLLWMYMA